MVNKEFLQPFHYVFDEFIIESVSKYGTLKHFKSNDIILDIGQELKHVPLLLNGNIKISSEDSDGSELLIYTLEAGDTCAMSLTCCMAKSKSKIRAVADKDSTLIMIPNEKMTQWFHNNESWRTFILQSYQVRFNEML